MYDKFIDFYNNYLKVNANHDFWLADSVILKNLTLKNVYWKTKTMTNKS